MDKYEYQVCADQIQSLLDERKYVEAMDIADTIDWRRVKSVSMLCTVSEIYKINKRYEESRDILLLAYERYPNGRMIVYALCELAIKMDDVLQAIEYYKEFVQVAPGDTGSYILLYKIYEAQDVSLEERIEVLEEFKKRDYREKWAYELAYLYHKTGQETRCIEECDELILWFGEGKYVKKAMELKQEHAGLTVDQQIKYDGRQEDQQPVQQFEQSYGQIYEQGYEQEYNNYNQQGEMIGGMDSISVQPINTGKYSTINLQEELAKSMEEFLATEDTAIQAPYYGQTESLYESTQLGQNVPSYEMVQSNVSENSEQIQTENYAPVQTENYEPIQPDSYTQEYSQPLEQPVYEQPMELEMVEQSLEQQTISPAVEIPVVQSVQIKSALSMPETENDDINSSKQIEQPLVQTSLSDTDMVEKQITGQLNLDDILKGWEEKKKESEQKRLQEVKKKSLEQTNDIMSQLVGVIPGLQIPNEEEEPVVVNEQTDNNYSEEESHTEEAYSEETYIEKPTPTTSVVKAPITKSEVTMAIPGTLPSGRILTLEEEYGGNLAAIRKDDEELVKRQTGEIPAFDEQTKLSDQLLNEEETAETVEELTETKSTDNEQFISENDVNEEPENIEEQQQEQTEFPYEAEDYGEVEELEDIEQPEELDDIIKTRELPLDAIAQANYEADIESEYAQMDELQDLEEEESEDIEESLNDSKKKKSNHPSYMTLEEAPKSRREFDEEEQRIFARFEGIEVLKAQIVDVMDDMSMDADKGNVVVMGSDVSDRKGLAIDIVKAIQVMDSNFSGKVAKISGEALNKKNIPMTIKKLQNGALIVENAGGLTKDSMILIAESLSNEPDAVLVVLEGTKESVQPLLSASKLMKKVFDARIDIAEYTNDDLVAYGKGYAKELEYSIDEMGILALYTRIGELQALDHVVSVDEVKEIVDAAIKHVDRKNMSHFMDVLFGKRYDDDDYIVLREKDFITK